MGRPESRLTGEDAALLAFATGLRELRQRAGSPSYRELARRAHYSPSALSQAAAGHTMPTLAVTIAFVQACGGDVAEWEQRWRTATGTVDPPHAGGDLIAQSDPTTPPAPTVTMPRRRHRRMALLLVAGVMAIAVSAALLVAAPPARTDVRETPTSGPRTVDGVDPKDAGCAADGTTIDSVELVFPRGRLAGAIELRYSPSCRAAWTRFTPESHTGRGPSDTVTVEIVRPSDSIAIPFTITYGDLAVFSDMLSTRSACVLARATVTHDGQSSPRTETRCLAP